MRRSPTWAKPPADATSKPGGTPTEDHFGAAWFTGKKDRMIRFDLSIALDYQVLAPSDFIFIIQPTHTPYQRVTWERLTVDPQVPWSEDDHGDPVNRHLRVHAEPGRFQLRYDAIVDVVHHFALPSDIRELPIAELPASVLQYVYPSRYCQSD